MLEKIKNYVARDWIKTKRRWLGNPLPEIAEENINKRKDLLEERRGIRDGSLKKLSLAAPVIVLGTLAVNLGLNSLEDYLTRDAKEIILNNDDGRFIKKSGFDVASETLDFDRYKNHISNDTYFIIPINIPLILV